MHASPLVIFDIDGTLAHGSAATHLGAIGDALHAVYGMPDPFTITADGAYAFDDRLDGRTDRAIVTACVAHAGLGVPDADELAKLFRHAARCYEVRLAEGQSAGTAAAGASELLGGLAADGVHLCLGTGNARSVCTAKLTALSLGRHFGGDELLGGFGDTPHDVTAAAAAGLPCVGVSGTHDVDVLWDSGAAAVVEHLGAPARDVLDRVLARTAAQLSVTPRPDSPEGYRPSARVPDVVGRQAEQPPLGVSAQLPRAGSPFCGSNELDALWPQDLRAPYCR